MAMKLRIRGAQTIPRPRVLTGPLHHHAICGEWTLRHHHDTTTNAHRLGVNRYMRPYMRAKYRTSLAKQIGRDLGTTSVVGQEKLPQALYEVAVMRRRMLEAAQLVGRWSITDGQISNDPS